jgi:hypothetical protein
MTTRILRPAQLYRTKRGEGKLAVGHTKFEKHFVLHDDDDPCVPGTNVPRLRAVALGERAIGFFEDEVDALIEGLRQHRDAVN